MILRCGKRDNGFHLERSSGKTVSTFHQNTRSKTKFRYFSVWIFALSLCWTTQKNQSESFDALNAYFCFLIELTQKWKKNDKNLKSTSHNNDVCGWVEHTLIQKNYFINERLKKKTLAHTHNVRCVYLENKRRWRPSERASASFKTKDNTIWKEWIEKELVYY